jgi:hypothetical protein
VSLDRFGFCHVIHWYDETQFADNGDCGSIYFYECERLFIPFAVHVTSARCKSNPDKKVSFGVSLTVKNSSLKFGDYEVDFDIGYHKSYIQFNNPTNHEEFDDTLG